MVEELGAEYESGASFGAIHPQSGWVWHAKGPIWRTHQPELEGANREG